MKFANQNFPSARIFVSSETTKFLFTLQARKFAYIVLQKVLICTQFSCIWIAFWSKTPNGWTYSTPPYSLVVGNTHLLFANHFWKDNSTPDICVYFIYIIYKMHVYIYRYICIRYTYIYIYIYVYIYICIYMYVCIYIYNFYVIYKNVNLYLSKIRHLFYASYISVSSKPSKTQ